MGILLNHMGHSYHSVSIMDAALLVVGVVVAVALAYVVTSFIKRQNREDKTTSK
ncbi:MAG: hypothetical protein SNJ33_05100 [Rikenellaceae bacterium]